MVILNLDVTTMTKLFVCNWKMYLTPKEERMLAAQLAEISSRYHIIIAPSFLTLKELSHNAKFDTAAQSVSGCEIGAYTSQVSAKALCEIGCKYVIIGHSEVRSNGVEQDVLNLSVRQTLSNGLRPIYCIGESEGDHIAKRTTDVLYSQLSALQDLEGLIIAYEPVWAIGTGRTPTVDEISSAMSYIKSVMKNAVVLYGGSVSSSNSQEILALQEVDGVLVGSASVKINELQKMLKQVQRDT